MIYEGANGVQALDLVGRKLGADGGKPMMAFFRDGQNVHQGSRSRHSAEGRHPRPPESGFEGIADIRDVLRSERRQETRTRRWRARMTSCTCSVTSCWATCGARMAVVATKALADCTGDPAFYEAKLATRALLHGAPPARCGNAPRTYSVGCFDRHGAGSGQLLNALSF